MVAEYGPAYGFDQKLYYKIHLCENIKQKGHRLVMD